MTEETKMILEQLQKMDDRMQKMDDRLQVVEKKVTNVQLTLENEVNRNIKVIAEGHLDLSRRFSDALKSENEREMLQVRMNMAEADIRRLKEAVFASA